MRYLARRMHLLPRHTCGHPTRCLLEHALTRSGTFSHSARLLLLTSRNYFRSESKPFPETSDAAAEGESGRRTPQPMPEPPRSSWLERQAGSRFLLQRRRDAHARSIRRQSCNLYPEEKPPACSVGSTRALFAQRLTGPLDRVRRKPRSIFSGNSHKQPSLPFELDR
jgi:hypothetical protein